VHSHRIRVVSVLALACAVLGCAATPRGSGFLADTQSLSQVPEHPGTWRWIKPGLDLRPYDKVMIDPVELGLAPASVAQSLHPESRERYAAEFTEVLRAKIAPFYEVVEIPGPNTLRLRIALTDLLIRAEGVEDSSFESEILDAQTGERLCAVLATGAGRPREGVFEHWARRLLDFLDSKGVERK